MCYVCVRSAIKHCNTLQQQRTATRCNSNTLQHAATATHYNTLQQQRTATRCNSNALQHAAAPCTTLQHAELAVGYVPRLRKLLVYHHARICNTLQ